MNAEQRAALERGLAQADAGEFVEADEVLAKLQRP
jgi:predicted transcriptional regulator